MVTLARNAGTYCCLHPTHDMTTPDNTNADEDDLHRVAMEAWELRLTDAPASCERATQVHRHSDPARAQRAWAWAESTLTWHLGASGREAETKRRLHIPIGIFTVIDDKRGLAAAWAQLARCALGAGDTDRTFNLLGQIEPLLRWVSSEERVEWFVLSANCAGTQGRTEDAIQHLTTAFEGLPPASFRRQLRMLNNLANLCSDLGDYATALGAFMLALEMARRHCPEDVLFVSVGAMQLHVMAGDRREGLRLARPLLPRLRELVTTHPRLAPTLGFGMAWVFAFTNEPARARECVDIALAGMPNGTNEGDRCHLDTIRAQVALVEGDETTAKVLATGALAASHARSSLVERRCCLDILVECARRAGDPEALARLAAERARVPAKASLVGQALVNQLWQLHEATIQGELLSDRERSCLSLAAKGQTSRDIADKLGINQRTVDFHFANIVRKLDVLNRQEAIAKAAKAQWLH